MTRTQKRKVLTTSDLSHKAVVDGRLLMDEMYALDVVQGNVETRQNAGLFNPALMSRIVKPEQIRLCAKANGASIIWEDRSIGGARLRQLIVLRNNFVREFDHRWSTYRSAAMRELRRQCTVEKPRWKFVNEPRTKVLRWSYSIRVLRDDLLKLPYAVWPGMPPSDVPLALDSYKPSNPTKLALGTGKDVVAIRVQRSKVIHYVAHVRKSNGVKRWLNRPRLAREIRAWMDANPRPPASQQSEYLALTREINALKRNMSREWKRCVNLETAGYVDGREFIVSFRAAHAPYTVLSDGKYPWGAWSESIAFGHWPAARDKIAAHPCFVTWGDIQQILDVNFSPKVYQVSSQGIADSRKGSAGEILQGVNFPVIQDELESTRYDRARLALENGQLDGDDLDKADFNAFRSVAELKDLGQTVTQARDFIRWLKVARHGKLLRAGVTLKGAASAYLAQLFAVQPTIDDINTLLKYTRAELLGVRRGLWKLASALNLYQSNAVTLRKYSSRNYPVPRRPRRGLDPSNSLYQASYFREQFPETWSVTRSYPVFYGTDGHMVPIDSVWTQIALRPEVQNVSKRDTLGNVLCGLEENDDFRYARNRVEESLLTHWYFGDERAVLFASFKPEEVLNALDPSRVENLAETMKLAKNVWELYPLSFVVDWLMTTGEVARDIQNLLGSNCSGLFSDSGVWCALPQNLYAVTPRYHVTQTLTPIDFRVESLGARPGWDSSLPWWCVRGPSTCVLTTEYRLDDVIVNPTGVRRFARGPMVAALADPRRTLRLLAPRFRVNLGTGQLSTLLAMLISST